jgi:YD repeat-containing protein
MSASSKSRRKRILWILTLTAVLLFLLLQIAVRHFERTVRLKSEAERAKLPVAMDSHPCLLVSRKGPTEPLLAVIQQCSPALNNDIDIEQFEVDLRSGMFLLRRTDLFVADSMPLALTRGYRLWDQQSRAFGIGGNHPYDIFPYGDHFPYTYMELVLGDGTSIHYSRISKGTSFSNFLAEHNGTPALIFQKSTVGWNIDHWDMRLQDGTLFRFPEAYNAKRGVEGALVGMRSPRGEEIRFVRDARRNLKNIISPHNRQITFAYDENDRVIEAADDRGNVMHYAYDHRGQLVEVLENGHVQWRYRYDVTGMTGVQDGAGQDILVNRYSRDRIASLTLEKNQVYRFDYLVTGSGRVEETMVTDPSGKATMLHFSPSFVRHR